MIEPILEADEHADAVGFLEERRHSDSPKRTTHVRVVLPAFNEAESLVRLVPRIVETLSESFWDFDILVVDDGSSDDTVEVTRELQTTYPVRLVCHQGNQEWVPPLPLVWSVASKVSMTMTLS